MGNYSVYIVGPPELADGYFMPDELHKLLLAAVKATISKLPSL